MTPDQKEKGIMQSDILASHLPKALLQKLHRSLLQFGLWLLQISVKRSQAEGKKAFQESKHKRTPDTASKGTIYQVTGKVDG